MFFKMRARGNLAHSGAFISSESDSQWRSRRCHLRTSQVDGKGSLRNHDGLRLLREQCQPNEVPRIPVGRISDHTGVSEGACQHLVKDRMERSGMPQSAGPNDSRQQPLRRMKLESVAAETRMMGAGIDAMVDSRFMGYPVLKFRALDRTHPARRIGRDVLTTYYFSVIVTLPIVPVNLLPARSYSSETVVSISMPTPADSSAEKTANSVFGIFVEPTDLPFT